VEKKLRIEEKIKGGTMEAKIDNLIEYFEQKEKDGAISISMSGYDKLLKELAMINRPLKKKIKAAFELQEDDIMQAKFLLNYNIKPMDVLYLMEDQEVRPEPARRLPGASGLFAAGAGIGAISSVLAAGGAFLSIPYLVRRNMPVRRAIGTAAAIGFPIAFAGTVGYVLHGLHTADLPAGSLGFVYLPALVIVIAASMPMAPLGARLAHRLPVRRLRMVFSLVLLALALRMLANLW
jgi:hypothetical protein